MTLERIQTSYCKITIQSGDKEEFITNAAKMLTYIAADIRDDINTLEWKGLTDEVNIKRAGLKEEVENVDEIDMILNETLEKTADDTSDDNLALEENEQQLIHFILQKARAQTDRSQDDQAQPRRR